MDEQWRRYTVLFPLISIRVRATTFSSLVDPDEAQADAASTMCMINAQGWMKGVISRDAIAAILPHVLHREELVRKLLGKQLDCPVRLRFQFNSAGRIIRFDLDADFFEEFRTVDSVEMMDLVQLMENAAIGENSSLPDI